MPFEASVLNADSFVLSWVCRAGNLNRRPVPARITITTTITIAIRIEGLPCDSQTSG